MKNFLFGLLLSLIFIYIWAQYVKPHVQKLIKISQSSSLNQPGINNSEAPVFPDENINLIPSKNNTFNSKKEPYKNHLINKKSPSTQATKSVSQSGITKEQTSTELRKTLLTMVENADESQLKIAKSIIETFAKPDPFNTFSMESDDFSDSLSTQNRETELETGFLQLAPFKGLATLSSVKCKETICKVVFSLPSGIRFTPFSLYNWDKTLITVSMRHMEDNGTIINAYFPLDKSNPEGYKQIFGSLNLP